MKNFSNSCKFTIENTSILLQKFMVKVYSWMTYGLFLTTIVSWIISKNTILINIFIQNRFFSFLSFITQLILIFFIFSFNLNISYKALIKMFTLYSILNGITCSTIFLTYTNESITNAFLINFFMFGFMSIYGYYTKKDLSKFNKLALMFSIGLLVAVIVNILLRNSYLTCIINYISVIFFTLLIAIDIQKIKNLCLKLIQEDREDIYKYSILGALNLYLNFFNLFISILRLFGKRK